MKSTAGTTEKLSKFIEDYHEGKQKRLAEAYGLSPSQISGWVKPGGDVPVYMDKIIDLTRERSQFKSELLRLKKGGIVQMVDCYAIVRFPEDLPVGTILCSGIADLETAQAIAAGLLHQNNGMDQ